MKKNQASLPLIVVSDLHVNSTMGIWPEEFEGEDGNLFRQNKFQRTLWRWWGEFIEWADTQTGGKFDLVFNGDLVQGVHSTKDISVIVSNHKDMRRAAAQVMEPLARKARKLYIVRGTEWHDGKGGEDIETIAEDLEAERDVVTGQYSRWILWKRMGSKLGHFTHHISVSSDYPLTAMRKEIDRAKREHVDHGQPMPDFQVRSHRHQCDVALDGDYSLFVTPAWQLGTSFVVKRNPLSLGDIGGLLLYEEDNEVRWKFKKFVLPHPVVVAE